MLCYFVHDKVWQPPLLILSNIYVIVQQARHARTAVLALFPMPVDKHSACGSTYKVPSALQDPYLLIFSLHVVLILPDVFHLLQPSHAVIHQATHAVVLCLSLVLLQADRHSAKGFSRCLAVRWVTLAEAECPLGTLCRTKPGSSIDIGSRASRHLASCLSLMMCLLALSSDSACISADVQRDNIISELLKLSNLA